MHFTRRHIVTVGSIFFSGFFVIGFSCTNYKKNKSHENVSDASITKGKALAAIHCQSCHLFPDPLLLDAKTWEAGVLPQMGPRLGIFDHNGIQYPSSKNDPNLDKNFYPQKPAITAKEWQSIIDYYTALSPDSLYQPQRAKIIAENTSLFKVETPVFTDRLPTTCFVKIDTFSRQLIISDAVSNNIFRFNSRLQVLDSFKTASAVVDMERHENKIVTCNIGVMNPNNGRYGAARGILVDSKGSWKADSGIKLNGLSRPVQVSSADLNADGKTDYLVCEFGNLTGALSWMEAVGDGKYEKHIVRALPGPIKAYIRDENKDGLPDIWVLFTQGEEGVFLFTNKGNGKFDQEQVLRFPSINGSSYFEFADFNKDGYQDILYTCGDNADYSPVLKPYHGAYIFMNDSSNHFKQEYFLPMHGCFKAMARDFDRDGDLDIAAISFFADYANKPEESFLYLENNGGLRFQPFSIPYTTTGRWLTMDVGDIDGDGRADIVLGNFSIAPASIKRNVDWKNGPPFIVLRNIIKK
jgi:hypothetical protein